MLSEQRVYQIKETLKNTRARRKLLNIKVVELKIDESHLSQEKKEKLDRAFLEAKWIANEHLANEDLFENQGILKKVIVQTFNPETGKCDIPEERKLTLGSQIGRAIVGRIRQDVYNLASSKKKGYKTGKLKFKREVNSIPLVQFDGTHRLKQNGIFIQKLGRFRVNGMDQIQNAKEFGNANLLRKASGYYVKLTCYFEPETFQTSGEIGIDMGITDTVTLSTGEKLKMEVPFPKSLRRCHQKLSRKKKNSKNYNKNIKRIRRKYERLTNQKDDMANKFVSSLKGYSLVAFQDENIAGWQKKWYGKQVSTSVFGRIKDRLKKLTTSVMIDRFLPTTKLCPSCGKLNNTPLDQRIYSCECLFVEDRDTKSAKTILDYARKTLAEREGQPVETLTSGAGVSSVTSRCRRSRKLQTLV